MTLTKEQLALRKRGLGGSEMAAIAGLDPYRTPRDVWLGKMGLLPPFEGNRFTHWGHRLEVVMATEYEARMSVALKESPTVVSEENPWHLGTPDRLVFKTRRHRIPLWGLECKARSIRTNETWGIDGTDEVPPSVAIQCHWYMALTKLDRWDVVVLIGGNDFRRFELRRDPKIEKSLIDMGRKFWETYVVTGEAPPMDHSKTAREVMMGDVLKKPRIIPAPSDAEKWFNVRRDAVANLKKYDERKRLAENNLIEMVGEHGGMNSPWGNVRVSEVDEKEIQYTRKAYKRVAFKHTKEDA